MTTRNFHIGDILSITTDRLVSPKGIGGIYEILNFMTGDNLFTHQLPRASRECNPWLLRQHPQLADVDAAGVNSENWRSWLDEQVKKFGQELPVSPIPADDHDRRDPVEEAQEMVGKNKVMVVELDEQ